MRHLQADSQFIDIVDSEHIPAVKRFLTSLRATDQSIVLADQIEKGLRRFLEHDGQLEPRAKKALRRLFRGCQEMMFFSQHTYCLLRPKIGVKRMVRLHPDGEKFEAVTRYEYLRVKDAYIQGAAVAAKPGLVLDFSPYFANFPKVNEPSELGKGISFLNRYLSGQMYQNPDGFRLALLRFLIGHHLEDINLLANDSIHSVQQLVENLDNARSILADYPDEASYGEVAMELRNLGFEAGWGRTVGRIAETLSMLANVVHSPDARRFESFLERIPVVRRVLMISPHGWFAQEGVLGRPDTGGQVVYVLDQARALEARMRRQFMESGIELKPHLIILTRLIPDAQGTACNVPREKVHGSENCWILRVPFRDVFGEIVREWISRFHIWPYLEDFAEEAKSAIITELLGKPDLIVGNYSDGNLVAYLLADDLGVTHCALAHALEKTKYLFSDMRWADMEEEYRFSLQFTADIIAYNSADFIITSTYREIGGSPTEMGMFESYETFSMPGLYRVLSGMDPQLARYNIVPPGANEEYFYPNTERERRVDAVAEKLNNLIFPADPHPGSVGHLDNPELPPIFAMSRLDKIKNLPGLVEAFGKSSSLRQKANLVIVASTTDASSSRDQEEIDQIHRLYELIERYNLSSHFRWVGARLDKVETGEIYRIVADRRGIFAQPAIMETFGLTVIEAMSCGVPVVATCFGGPAEIIVDGVSGRIVNPNDHEAFTAAIEEIIADSDRWNALSHGGIQRVEKAFTWRVHADNVLRLANVYGYWNYLDVMNRSALDQYIHTVYHTVYRPRAQALLGR